MSWLLKIKNSHWSFRLITALLSLEIISILAWRWPFWGLIFLILLAIVLSYTLWSYPQAALFVPVFELFNGAMGRSLSYGFVSLRLVIFVVIVLYYIGYFILKKPSLKISKNKILWRFYLVWLGILLLGLINAYFHQSKILKIFLDFNNYLYWLYLPIWYQVYQDKYWLGLWHGLRLIAVYLAIKVLIIFSIFSQIDYQQLVNFYKWLRDTRWAEITPLGFHFYRVFSQSELLILLAFLGLWLKQINNLKNYKNLFLIIICATALLLSLSRSFWLGGLLAWLIMLILAKFYLQSFSLKLLCRQVFIVFIASSALVMLLYNIPTFNGGNIFKFSNTESSGQSLSSRQALWQPLNQTIAKQPILGYGFGKEISYYSSDPRIKNDANPSGQYSSYALEWGWLDFVLKLGLVGTIFILICLALMLWQAYAIIKQSKVSIFLLASLLALVFIHFFSPYLNHPLGIGWLMILLVYINNLPPLESNQI